MSRLDELPPDQRAALRCCCASARATPRSRTLLGIPERAVHDRAHAALAVLAPRAGARARPRAAPGDRRLPARPAAGRRRAPAHAHLPRAAPSRRARGRARVAAELAPLATAAAAGDPGRARGAPARRAPAPQRVGDPSAAPRRAGARRSGAASAAPLAARALGGAIAARGDRRGDRRRRRAAHRRIERQIHSHGTARPQAPPARAESRPDDRRSDRRCTAPSRGASSVGVVEVLTEGGKRAFYIEAEHLPADQRLLLRDLAVQLADQRRGRSSKAPPVGSRPPPRRAARCCPRNAGELQRNPAHARDQARARRTRARSCCDGPVQPRRLSSGSSLPGFMIPAGIELALERAQRRDAAARPPRCAIHGAWSRPTAWWWVIVPPPATIASPAARLTARHCAISSPSRWRAISVKYSEAPRLIDVRDVAHDDARRALRARSAAAIACADRAVQRAAAPTTARRSRASRPSRRA